MGDLQYPKIDWRYRFHIGTDSIYFRPIFQTYVSEYHHKIWSGIWYSTFILGSCFIPIEIIPVLIEG